MNKKDILFFVLPLIVFILFIYPFIKYILFGFVLFVLSRPIYIRINRISRFKEYYKFNAALSIIIVVFLFVLIAFIVFSYVYRDLISLLVAASELPIDSGYILNNDTYKEFLAILYPYIRNILNAITAYIYNLLVSMPREFLGYFLSFLVSYYILIYEDRIENITRSIFNISLYEILDKSYSVLAGHFLLWFIQAFLSFIGLYLIGIKYAVLLSILIFLFAVLPLLGPWTIWVTLAIYGLITNNTNLVVFSLIYGMVLVSTLTEIIIKPYLLGKLSDINPLIVFLGIIGGVNLFGIPGLIIGPILLEISKDILLSYKS